MVILRNKEFSRRNYNSRNGDSSVGIRDDYGTPATPDLKETKKDHKWNRKTAKAIIKFNPDTTLRNFDGKDISKRIENVRLNLENSKTRLSNLSSYDSKDKEIDNKLISELKRKSGSVKNKENKQGSLFDTGNHNPRKRS